MRPYLAHPEWLSFLAALPLLLIRTGLGRARRLRGWSALGQGGRPARDGSWLWVAAVLCLAAALAQPRWGRSDRPPLPPGRDVVLAVDVSRSMGARDAVPDRLGVAVESALTLVAALGRAAGDRVAVVAFAGRGVRRCPLTLNLGAVAETLRALRPGDVRPGETDLGAGLDASLDAFDDQDRAGGRTVVAFSDGEDHAARATAAADRLRAQGVIVHTVAVGDAERGHPVPSRAGPDSDPIRYRGSVVLSKRVDDSLRSIARETGGAFVPLGLSAIDLGRLYRTRIEPVAAARRHAVLNPEASERFGPFLLAGLGFGLAASWPFRPRPVPGRVWVLGLAGTVAILFPGAGPGRDAASAVEAGRLAYTSGHYPLALEEFRRAIRLAPGFPVPCYDAASALFQLENYEEAQAFYLAARVNADAGLRTRIDYALGNTALALGDFTAAIGHYDQCVASTARGGDLDRVRGQATANRRFAEEQAKRALAPPDDGEGPQASRPREQPGGRDPNAGGENPGGQGSGANPPAEGGRDDSPPGSKGSGGAGGEGPAPPRAGSPEDQLSKALENVHDSRRHRIEEDPAPDDRRQDRKDW